MNKKLLILIIILLILLIILISMGIFLFLNKNKPKIIETKTFSEISGFSFEYPVFKNWEVAEIKKISENEYYIKFNVPGDVELYMPPQLNIKKINEPSKQTDNLGMKKNANGVWYSELSGLLGYVFSSNNFRVVITLISGGVEKKGFLSQVTINKIIDSFKFTSLSGSSIEPDAIYAMTHPVLLTSLPEFSEKYQNAISAVMEKLKQDKENPDNFYVKMKEKNQTIIFELSHKDDYKPENINTIGNPSGKSRTIIYDTNQSKIISDLLWK
ncbi:hypothetical protein KKG36_00190 [Patescibacteria group bacterium]|nr:hypothetical protein [Patescibacteria group bacterium]